MERGTIGLGSRCGRVDESYVESFQARKRENVIKQPPYDPSHRKIITLDGFPDAHVSHMLSVILKNMFNGSWTNWKEVNKTARDELWAHFKRFYQWEGVTDGLVHEVWEESMKIRYLHIMLKARKKSIQMAQSVGVQFDGFDFSVLKPYNPNWIKSCYWQDMIDRVWNTDEWKMKSKSIRVNQITLKESSKHLIVYHRGKKKPIFDSNYD